MGYTKLSTIKWYCPPWIDLHFDITNREPWHIDTPQVIIYTSRLHQLIGTMSTYFVRHPKWYMGIDISVTTWAWYRNTKYTHHTSENPQTNRTLSQILAGWIHHRTNLSAYFSRSRLHIGNVLITEDNISHNAMNLKWNSTTKIVYGIYLR